MVMNHPIVQWEPIQTGPISFPLEFELHINSVLIGSDSRGRNIQKHKSS